MDHRPSFQISVAALLGVVACVAFNVWLFRLGALWGIIGLNLTKHVVIAYLCQVLGVDRRKGPGPSGDESAAPANPGSRLELDHPPISAS